MPEWMGWLLSGTGIFLAACVIAGFKDPDVFVELAQYALTLIIVALVVAVSAFAGKHFGAGDDVYVMLFAYLIGLFTTIKVITLLAGVIAKKRAERGKEKYRLNYHGKAMERRRRH